MRNIFILVSAALSMAASAFAEETPIVENFIGTWISDGDAFGAPAQTTMVWANALGGAFTHLDYRIEMRPASKSPSVFAGKAYYKRDGEGAYRAFWADSSGFLHPIVAVREGAALSVDWGVAGAKQGRTRYELTGEDEMQVTDWVLTDQGWREFNSNVFSRQSAETE